MATALERQISLQWHDGARAIVAGKTPVFYRKEPSAAFLVIGDVKYSVCVMESKACDRPPDAWDDFRDDERLFVYLSGTTLILGISGKCAYMSRYVRFKIVEKTKQLMFVGSLPLAGNSLAKRTATVRKVICFGRYLFVQYYYSWEQDVFHVVSDFSDGIERKLAQTTTTTTTKAPVAEMQILVDTDRCTLLTPCNNTSMTFNFSKIDKNVIPDMLSREYRNPPFPTIDPRATFEHQLMAMDQGHIVSLDPSGDYYSITYLNTNTSCQSIPLRTGPLTPFKILPIFTVWAKQIVVIGAKDEALTLCIVPIPDQGCTNEKEKEPTLEPFPKEVTTGDNIYFEITPWNQLIVTVQGRGVLTVN